MTPDLLALGADICRSTYPCPFKVYDSVIPRERFDLDPQTVLSTELGRMGWYLRFADGAGPAERYRRVPANWRPMPLREVTGTTLLELLTDVSVDPVARRSMEHADATEALDRERRYFPLFEFWVNDCVRGWDDDLASELLAKQLVLIRLIEEEAEQ